MNVYLVGGAVRDRLLDIESAERDWVVVGARAEDLLAQGFKPVGKDFPVFLHPETREEYALARTERKVDKGYHGFVFHADPTVTLAEDLKRRDLTINAMAMTPGGEIIDPYGGREDLEAGRLRHVSDAFREDPVRILRVARFAARFAHRGFRVSHATQRLMREMVAAGEVDALVPERVWKETQRALEEPTPSRFFEVMRSCGALARLFPEIDRLFGVPQPSQHHPEVDTGVHVMMVLEQAARLSADARVRFAALLHDLGKGETPVADWPRHKGHEQRSLALVRGVCDRLRVPGDYCDLANMVAEHHGRFRRVGDVPEAEPVVRFLEELDAFRRPERFDRFLLACEADLRGRRGFEEKDFSQPADFRRALAAANEVKASAVMASGARGPEIRTALHAERVAAVRPLFEDRELPSRRGPGA
ncbi:MAG: multifunctional CCA addition/repair protein [Pseudomonadota bacterium]